MKILVMGCGSIGSRHARNLKLLGIKDLVLCDNDDSRLKLLGNEIGCKLLYTDHKMAVRENFDILAAIICTPTAFHIDSAIFFAKHKIHLFIEKPLSNSLININLLSNLATKNHLIIMMGHSYIFENGFVKLKSLLDKKTIGDTYFVTYLQGQFLPDWHPKIDYRYEYSAKKELGGGALLTLTSHTFYLIEWLFGRIKSIHGKIVDNISPLEVNVDDTVLMLLKTQKNIIVQTTNNFIVGVHQHKMIVEGEKGRIEYDFVEKQITILLRGGKPKIIHVDKGPNDRFIKEMKYFLEKLKRNKTSEDDLDLKSGIRFLKFVKNLRN